MATSSEIGSDGDRAKTATKAQITLDDCLACVGCVTTAEEILVTEQSFDKLDKVLLSNQNSDSAEKRLVVLSLSTEALASLAASLNLDLDLDLSIDSVSRRLASFFKGIGVDYVIDESFGHLVSLERNVAEFLERYRRKQEGEKTVLPMLTSACPGWICYAEKTHGSYILPYISTSRSGQQIQGSLVKRQFYKHLKSKIYHVTFMACFDKKLEASRGDFTFEGERDVDCVITPGELQKALLEKNICLRSLDEIDLDSIPVPGYKQEVMRSFLGQGSGGFLEYVLRRSAKTLFSLDVDEVKLSTLKNEDMKEATVEFEGQVKLRFLRAHGFRNIQNVVQKLKRKMKFNYDFVEIMACPSGCLNGGGQIKVAASPATPEALKLQLQRVRELYENCEIYEPDNDTVSELAEELTAAGHVTTGYRAIAVNTNALTIKW